MSDENTPERVLKSPEIKRDPEGRFERHGKAISKTAKKQKPSTDRLANLAKTIESRQIKKAELINPQTDPEASKPNRGRGRPKGSLNKTTLALKEQILAALDVVGGAQYLATLAIENSSAFAGLLGKVLPSTLAMSDSSTGKPTGVTFQRIIVWPDGHKEIEGVTPKQIAPPEIKKFPSPTEDE